MIYFNGFSLEGEECYFSDYIPESEYAVAGFSFGAQKALEYVLNSQERVDRLLLFSPAFFQNKKASFVRTQLRYFQSDRDAYIAQFCKNSAFPSNIDLHRYISAGSKNDLETLLTYVWREEKIKNLLQRGTEIEVFLGEKDKIIDFQEAFDFFSAYAATYVFKGAGHLLRDHEEKE